MRFSLLKFIGVIFLVLALFSAWRTRRDLAAEETQWGRALYRRSAPLRRAENPLRYWLASALNIAVVLLFTLAAVFVLRAGLLRLGLH